VSGTERRRVVEAAGCVVWRRTSDDHVEVVLVHRPPPHDDWSLPKGKLDRGESHAEAAVREVHEETGFRGELGPGLGEVRYDLPAGGHKHVRFWAMEALSDDGWSPGDEIDGLRWVRADRAAGELTWSSDREVLARFASTCPADPH
jgi:8-oxo-dGTP pyrophosphatase MutT (NUDIX family)